MLNENDRLTHEHAAGWFASPYSKGDKYWTNATKTTLMNRLGEYEDIGLSPGEIRQLIDTAKGMDDYTAILMGFKKLPIQEG